MRTLLSWLPRRWLPAGVSLLLGACSHPTEQATQTTQAEPETGISATGRPRRLPFGKAASTKKLRFFDKDTI